MADSTGFIPPHGNYEELLSYQKSEVIYDLTFSFCQRFLARNDRTIDLMVQAARSGKQNIIEASKASGTSRETEIKLTNVARASLEELLADYRDYLRVRDLSLWVKDCKEAQYVRSLSRKPELSFEDFRVFSETRSGEVVANIAICLIHQANYLLDQQSEEWKTTFSKKAAFVNEWRGQGFNIGANPRRHRSHLSPLAPFILTLSASFVSHVSTAATPHPLLSPFCENPTSRGFVYILAMGGPRNNGQYGDRFFSRCSRLPYPHI